MIRRAAPRAGFFLSRHRPQAGGGEPHMMTPHRFRSQALSSRRHGNGRSVFCIAVKVRSFRNGPPVLPPLCPYPVPPRQKLI